MMPIEMPDENFNHPDSVLARTVAADSGWTSDDDGQIFDRDGKRVAKDIEEAGVAMRKAGWFVPTDAQATGVNWKEVPDDSSERAAAVRSAM